MSFFLEHKKGTVGAIVFHIVLIILLIFLGFTTPLPLPEEEGILINFGTEDQGSGLIEPSTASSVEETKPEPESTSLPEIITESNEEEVVTQDFEEAVAVPSGKEKVEKKPDPKELEAERKRQEEIERIRQAEFERKRQEELERKRLEEEQRKINEINRRTQNAFSGKNTVVNESKNEGITSGEGNQGGINGSTESKNYSGTGLGNKGISYSLSGRTPQSLPLPEYNYQVEGIVVVEVTVDRSGKVTKATAGVKGSTTLDENLLRAARKAALAARFDRKPNAPAFQKGTITYHFLLQ